MRPDSSEETKRPDPARRGSATIAIWLGVWGIIISLVCIYIALDARNVAKDAERRLERNVEQLQEMIADSETVEMS